MKTFRSIFILFIFIIILLFSHDPLCYLKGQDLNRGVCLFRDDHLSDLVKQENDCNPRRSGGNPSRLVQILLLFLVPRFPSWKFGLGSSWCRQVCCVLNQVDGRNGNRTERDRNVLCQHLVLCGVKNKQFKKKKTKKNIKTFY